MGAITLPFCATCEDSFPVQFFPCIHISWYGKVARMIQNIIWFGIEETLVMFDKNEIRHRKKQVTENEKRKENWGLKKKLVFTMFD